MIDSKDITVIFQGEVEAVSHNGPGSFAFNVMATRKALPGARIILSTWQSTVVPLDVHLDTLIRSDDPGGLPGIKFTAPSGNNVNRQIVSTRRGLEAVETKYALKLRTDSYLDNAGFLAYIDKHFSSDRFDDRILVCTYYTLDPKMFERMAFHVSDWVQFGTTERLKALWGVDLMSRADASYHEGHRWPIYYNYFERQFRPRFAVEQHVWCSYAKGLGFKVPRYMVDLDPKVLHDFEIFAANKLMILEPWKIGIELKKYDSVGGSLYHRLNCLTYLDWLLLCEKHASYVEGDAAIKSMIRKRALFKKIWNFLFFLISPLHQFLFVPRLAPIRQWLKQL